jgi:mannose-6-phosphate isomerase-like protein (cupin superfamily)
MEEERGGRRGTETPYQQWQKGEGIPINRSSFVADLHTLEVAPWLRIGQHGAFVNLGNQESGDGYVLEIAPGGETKVQRHLFEVSLYVVSGRGATTIWQPGSRKQTVEWQAGSVFSPPLNCFYQHFNLDGQAPARLFGLSTAPRMINVFRSPDFVFSVDFAFVDRYNAEDDYFTDPGEHLGWRRWRTNFIPDIRAFKLDDYKERGAGGTNMHFSLANNSMGGHVSDFPSATYKMAHRHGVGPHLIILSGVGYSLFWLKGEERRRVDWKDGAVVVPEAMEYHQHFNTGPTNARYLVFSGGGGGAMGGRGGDPESPPPTAVSEREGGLQIDDADEDPAIYEEFAQECAKHAATPALPRPAYRR